MRHDQRGPVATTAAGAVRGTRQNGVPIFRGIPYAAPPTGSSRFRPPVPAEPWLGVREATAFGPMAPQYGPDHWSDPTVGAYMTGGRAGELIGAGIGRSEDCLTLNVLTPRVDPQAELPVLVYVHGCGYGGCSPATSTLADRFVREQQVVLVSVTHRLNVFGFLYLGDLDERYRDGNVGLLDLVQALRWVRQNVADFGGDPQQVTIFGESGGGMKVLDLMGMPQAAGLFHGAIVESAPAAERVDRDTATARARRLLDHLGVEDLDRLSEVPTDAVVEAMRAVGPRRVRPVVDGRTLTADVPATANGRVPLVIGDCLDEMTVLGGGSVSDDITWEAVAPELGRRLDLPPQDLQPVVELYRQQRPGTTPRRVLLQIWGDRLFALASTAIAEQHPQPVYRYHFAYPTSVDSGRAGAFHTAELPLALRLVHEPQAEALSLQLAGAWAAFARTGDPNHRELPHWEPYRPGQPVTMVFAERTHSDPRLHQAELAAVRALPSISTAQGR